MPAASVKLQRQLAQAKTPMGATMWLTGWQDAAIDPKPLRMLCYCQNKGDSGGVKTILRISMAAALGGFVVSFAIHVHSLFGWRLAATVWVALHAGIFILALPYLWLLKKFRAERGSGALLPVARFYKGCPPWMRKTVIGLFAYFVLVMVVFFIKTHGGGGSTEFEHWVAPDVAIFFSSGWMSFYSVLFAIFFSALKTIPWPLKCPNGHCVSPGRGYCEQCGALVRNPDSTLDTPR
jgi:hypothetical protein